MLAEAEPPRLCHSRKCLSLSGYRASTMNLSARDSACFHEHPESFAADESGWPPQVSAAWLTVGGSGSRRGCLTSVSTHGSELSGRDDMVPMSQSLSGCACSHDGLNLHEEVIGRVSFSSIPTWIRAWCAGFSVDSCSSESVHRTHRDVGRPGSAGEPPGARPVEAACRKAAVRPGPS